MKSAYPNQFTGQHVVVYDGEKQGMDTFSGRWQTVCETHGHILSHERLATAREWAQDVAEWCDDCRTIEEGWTEIMETALAEQAAR